MKTRVGSPWPERDAELIPLWNWRGGAGEQYSVLTISKMMRLPPGKISGRTWRLVQMGKIEARGSPIGVRYRRRDNPVAGAPSLSVIMAALSSASASVRVAAAEHMRAAQLGGQKAAEARAGKHFISEKSNTVILPRALLPPIIEPVGLGATILAPWHELKQIALQDGRLLSEMHELQAYNRSREARGKPPMFVRNKPAARISEAAE